MIQCRVNVFETNSSSTHSFNIFKPEDFKIFENGEVYIKDEEGVVDKLYYKEDVISTISDMFGKFTQIKEKGEI